LLPVRVNQSSSLSPSIFSLSFLDDVLRAINSLTSQAVGVYDLPQNFVKSALPSIITVICKIFNKSLSTATFPDRWK